MKIKELIAELQKLDQEQECFALVNGLGGRIIAVEEDQILPGCQSGEFVTSYRPYGTPIAWITIDL